MARAPQTLPAEVLLPTTEPLESLSGQALSWIETDIRQWALWLGVAAGLFIGLRFLRALLTSIAKNDTKPEHHFSNVLAALIKSTKQSVLLIVSLGITAPFFMTFPEQWARYLPALVMIASVIQVAIWIKIIGLGFLDNALARDDGDPRSEESLRALVALFINIGLFGISLVMILNNLGIDATGLLAGLGIGGIAIGLAAQSIFRDLFAGMSIMLDRPFVRGDYINFAGFGGTVEKIGLKTTRLKALGGEQISITNDNLLNNEIQNYKLMKERRVVFSVGVTYQTPHGVLASLAVKIQKIIEQEPEVRFDRCFLSTYGDSAIIFEAVYHVLMADYSVHMNAKQNILLGVHRLFEELSVEFAYPTQTIFLEKS